MLAKVIESSEQDETVPEILNKAFLAADSEVNLREGKFSGCTAIVAFVKVDGDKVYIIYVRCNSTIDGFFF